MADEYQFHPLCEAYPRMSAESFAAREDDYRRHPERAGESEVLLAVDPADDVAKIVDGRHHYLICRDLGYAPTFRTVDLSPADLVDMIRARNANRRHQTPSQIAASIAATSTWLNLYVNGGDRGNQHTGGRVQLCTLADSADEAGISRRTLIDASKAAKADPKLNEAVRDGKVSANVAAKVADLSKESRDAVTSAADPKKAAKDELKKAAAARDKAIRKAIRDNPDATPKQVATAVGKHCTVKHVEAVIAADKAKAAKKDAEKEETAGGPSEAEVNKRGAFPFGENAGGGGTEDESEPVVTLSFGPLGYDANDPPEWAVPADTGFTPAAVPEGEAERFVAEVESACRAIDAINGRLDVLSGHPLAYSLHVPSAVANLKSGRQTLWQGRPKHACPYCETAGRTDGKPCRACAGRGRVKKSTFDAGKTATGAA